MFLIETSWEVCNKVGGINTVLKSKAKFIKEKYGLRYLLIGPAINNNFSIEIDNNIKTPLLIKKLMKKLSSKGIKSYYGSWLINGNPHVLLLDYDSLINKKNELKKYYWDFYKIDSLFAGWDFEEPMLFASLTADVIILLKELLEGLTKEEEEITKKDFDIKDINELKKIIVHAHEWLSGFTILRLKEKLSKNKKAIDTNNIAIKTIFTTHATILGRAIASDSLLYENLKKINPEEKAKEYNIIAKFLTEKNAAINADLFTTVSDITSVEAEYFLGRKPEIILFNGLFLDEFPTIEETTLKHVKSRELIREFIAYYFFPYYNIDLEHTLIFFTSARFEFHNKGFDILIKALGKLNNKLKEINSKKRIIFFFWTPLSNNGINKIIIENKNNYFAIKNFIESHSKNIIKDFLINSLKGEESTFFKPELISQIKKEIKKFKRGGLPPLSTHDLFDNFLLNKLREEGLTNKEEDRIKIILYPAYLDGTDSLLGLTYYEVIVGTHLGVFPSYYEPWGYTPLESIALGVPAITSDLAGFGIFVKEQHPINKGIYVLKRKDKNDDEAIEELFNIMLNYYKKDHAERVKERLYAKNFSILASWEHFVKNYFKAYELLLNNNIQ